MDVPLTPDALCLASGQGLSSANNTPNYDQFLGEVKKKYFGFTDIIREDTKLFCRVLLCHIQCTI